MAILDQFQVIDAVSGFQGSAILSFGVIRWLEDLTCR
jgi:hypothetical protein